MIVRELSGDLPTLESVALLRRSFKAMLTEFPLTSESVTDLELVGGELFSNVVRHGVTKHIECKFTYPAADHIDCVEIDITGMEYLKGCVPNPQDLCEGGMGLGMVSILTDGYLPLVGGGVCLLKQACQATGRT